MKLCSVVFLITSLFAINGIAQERLTSRRSEAQKTPNVVAIKFTLLNSPGITDEGSRWETAYELRIANEEAYYEASRQGKFKGGSQERVGELIAQGSFTRKLLRLLKNRSIVLQVPLTRQIRERLKNQPKDRVKLTAATATADNIRLSREHEKKGQVFFFYSIANIYDAKLKKNVVVPINRIWMFGWHRDGEFKLEFEVTENGYKEESK